MWHLGGISPLETSVNLAAHMGRPGILRPPRWACVELCSQVGWPHRNHAMLAHLHCDSLLARQPEASISPRLLQSGPLQILAPMPTRL